MVRRFNMFPSLSYYNQATLKVNPPPKILLANVVYAVMEMAPREATTASNISTPHPLFLQTCEKVCSMRQSAYFLKSLANGGVWDA